MTILASIRPDSWNFALLMHIAGAAIFFGALVTMVTATLSADRSAQPAQLRRLGFRALLFVGLPAYLIMRAGAQSIYDKEFPEGAKDPTWIGIGFAVADLGLLLFLIALTFSGIAARKPESRLARPAGIIGAVLVVALLIAVWAMGAKPS